MVRSGGGRRPGCRQDLSMRSGPASPVRCPAAVPGNHDDGASPWLQPPRWSIAVVSGTAVRVRAALAACGHGGKVLLADANYSHSTNASPRAALIHLNVRPGLVTVDQVLGPVLA